MFKIFVGKNDGDNSKIKYNTNDVIKNCLDFDFFKNIESKFAKINIALGVYKKEFEDTIVISLEDYNEAYTLAKHLKNKLNQQEVLIVCNMSDLSNYKEKGFVKKNCFTVNCYNDFRNLSMIISSITGGTIFMYEKEIVLFMHDFYENLNSAVIKLQNKKIKPKHSFVYVKSI